MGFLQGEGEQSGGLFQLYMLHLSSHEALLLSLDSPYKLKKGSSGFGLPGRGLQECPDRPDLSKPESFIL